MYLINYSRLLKICLIFFTGLFYSTYCLATTSEEWINGLKNAEENKKTAEYFIDNPPPKGLVVLHSWDISPLKEVDRPVGHMSIQTAKWYLSVWPEEESTKAINEDIEKDFNVKGYTNFLILKVNRYFLSKSLKI